MLLLGKEEVHISSRQHSQMRSSCGRVTPVCGRGLRWGSVEGEAGGGSAQMPTLRGIQAGNGEVMQFKLRLHFQMNPVNVRRVLNCRIELFLSLCG